MRSLFLAPFLVLSSVCFGQQPVVGDSYGGGVVFWVNPDASNQGLVCDITDLGNANWGCEGESINGADDLGIGYGLANTIAIVNDCSENGIAAKLCNDYANYGFDDWYLPSINELEQIYLHKDIIDSVSVELGGDTLIDHVSYDSENNWISDYYVSSTEWTSAWCYIFNFDAGIYQNGSKDGCDMCYHVRPVRSYAFVSTPGCTDPTASNYDPEATEDDGSCCYAEWGDEWVQIGQDIDGEAAYDASGYSVSISNDGTRMATGAIRNDGNGNNAGHVRVYNWSGSSWIQLGSDIDGEAANDDSGYAISISANGNIVAVGAPYNDGSSDSAGHVRVYEYLNGDWVQIGQDIDGEAAHDESGYSVSISANGGIVAVGSRYNDGNGFSAGHVRIFENINGIWNQLGTDIDGEAVNDENGNSVSLSSDGYTVAIGAKDHDGNASQSGRVRIYNWNGITWVQLGNDIDGEAAEDHSGFSVSLSSAGNTVAIGAPTNNGNGFSAGHVRVYNWSGSSWIQLGSDIDGEAANDDSGHSVSLSEDGTILAIGSPWNDDNGSNSGKVKVYIYDGNSWSQIGSDIEGESSIDLSGHSVSLSSEGNILAIGAKQASSENGTESGHVRVYEINTPCAYGCTDSSSCNYNPEATADDGSCLFAGEPCDDGDEATPNDSIQEDCSCSGEAICTGSECCTAGTQWDLNTMSCVYDDECPTDIDKDGFVAVSDLLFLLSGYGTSCDAVSWGIGGENCQGAECCGVNTLWCESLEICIPLTPCGGDLNGDLAIGVDDLLTFLITYGTTCENFENIIICEACLGVFDECGVCDGPGATEVVIENITILYDSLYAEVIDEWWVFEIGADTTFSYTCPGLCGDAIEHEGYNYSTVLIGDQCWFSENCRYLPEVSPSSEASYTAPYYYVYDYQGTDVEEAKATANYDTYGVLYNWPAVMTEGICPSGWHMPSDEEWMELEMFLGMSESDASSTGWRGSPVGDYMKSTYGWNNNGNGTNSNGFTGLPGGVNRGGESDFGDGGYDGYWWSASEFAWVRIMSYNSGNVYRDGENRYDGFSARCIKD